VIGKFRGFGGGLQNDDNKTGSEGVRATFVEARPGRVAGRGLLERAKTRDDTVPFMITRQRQNSWFEVGTPTHTHTHTSFFKSRDLPSLRDGGT
jgi:hypothetical protein